MVALGEGKKVDKRKIIRRIGGVVEQRLGRQNKSTSSQKRGFGFQEEGGRSTARSMVTEIKKGLVRVCRSASRKESWERGEGIRICSREYPRRSLKKQDYRYILKEGKSLGDRGEESQS